MQTTHLRLFEDTLFSPRPSFSRSERERRSSVARDTVNTGHRLGKEEENYLGFSHRSLQLVDLRLEIRSIRIVGIGLKESIFHNVSIASPKERQRTF